MDMSICTLNSHILPEESYDYGDDDDTSYDRFLLFDNAIFKYCNVRNGPINLSVPLQTSFCYSEIEQNATCIKSIISNKKLVILKTNITFDLFCIN